jgi:hypothetical protein
MHLVFGRAMRLAPGLVAALAERRSVAAMEFAMIAPAIATMALGVFDIGRALIVWQQLNDAAVAITEAAEVMSITTGTGGAATQLTAAQLQNAMTTIYAQIPGLNLGAGNGMFPGAFSVTLSSVSFYPLCATAVSCGSVQTPYTDWSSYLTSGGVKLEQPPGTLATSLLRPCYPTALVAVRQFPNQAPQQLQDMVNPLLVKNGATMTLAPQLVADVSYQFTPTFPFFVHPVTLWASSALPAPFGGLSQQVALSPAGTYTQSTNPEACPTPPGS